MVELLSHGNGRKGRPDVTIILDANTILNGPHDDSVRETVNGDELAHETIRRLCCDAYVRTIRLDDDGKPIDVGRQHRTATRHQWAALKAIYSTCGWANCDRPVSWCQAHHITEWEHGGHTNLDNLIPLCSQHHHNVHEGQWNIKAVAGSDLTDLPARRNTPRHHHTQPASRQGNPRPPPAAREATTRPQLKLPGEALRRVSSPAAKPELLAALRTSKSVSSPAAKPELLAALGTSKKRVFACGETRVEGALMLRFSAGVTSRAS